MLTNFHFNIKEGDPSAPGSEGQKALIDKYVLLSQFRWILKDCNAAWQVRTLQFLVICCSTSCTHLYKNGNYLVEMNESLMS